MNRHGQDVGGRVRNLPSAAEANHEEPRTSSVSGNQFSGPRVPKPTVRVRSRHPLGKLTPGQKPFSRASRLNGDQLPPAYCRCIAGRGGGGWDTDLLGPADPVSLSDRVEIRNAAGAGAWRAIRTAATTELIRRPENCHPLRRPADSLMADDGVRRIRLFQVCDLVLGQSDGEGANGSLQMRNLRCPDDGRRHRLLL
jgi:hypothetical protein